jgi:hypothetical protein
MKYLTVLLIVLSAIFPVQGQSANWFETLSHLTVAKSTRLDVERLLKNPNIEQTLSFEGSKRLYYTSKAGKIEAAYSSGQCIGPHGYKLPLDTLLSISFSLSAPLKVSRLKLNLQDYERFRITKERRKTIRRIGSTRTRL